MDYFGQFQTDFVQLWSNVGHIWPFLDRKFALRLFQNTETAFRACFFVMEITFSMEKFPHSAVGFRSKDQAASRARIFSWSDNWGGDTAQNICSRKSIWSVAGWPFLSGYITTSWLHLASWNLPDSQLSWESKMEPSVAIITSNNSISCLDNFWWVTILGLLGYHPRDGRWLSRAFLTWF